MPEHEYMLLCFAAGKHLLSKFHPFRAGFKLVGLRADGSTAAGARSSGQD